jgi:hypothetical protein
MSRSGSASTGGAWARAFRFVARTRETGWSFAVVVTLVYLGYLISAHWHHEFWRDEIHSWSLARSADGFVDLVTGDRIYEGHPPLWFWYLRLWSFVVRSANGLHLATIAAMTAAALLFLRFAPFARALKVLLLFSYFLAFEYGVMSRNYTLDWLLVVIFCAALHPLRPRFIALAIVLGLLCITSAYGALLAAGLALAL